MYERLRAELLQTFPSLAHLDITHRWCGPVAISHSRRPFVGRTGRVWTAHGYSGLGVSWATLSGRVLADLVVGREEPWRNLLYLVDPMRALPPEPLTFLGFQAGYYGMRLMDFLDRFR